MFLLRVSCAFLLLILGLGYLFDPKAILRFNHAARETLFKDAHVLLNGKRIGLLLVLAGVILFVLSFSTPLP